MWLDRSHGRNPLRMSTSHKRPCAEIIDLKVPYEIMCEICQGLLEDAVQTPRCGATCCRGCIEKWLRSPEQPSCITCRKPIEASELQRDVKRDRISAAHPRPCLWVENGCPLIGRRGETRAHEATCQSIPRSMLRDHVAQLEATIQEFGDHSGDESLKKHLQCIFGFAQVHIHPRSQMQNYNSVQKGLWHAMAYACDPDTPIQHMNDIVGELVIKENNFNISARFRKFGPDRLSNDGNRTVLCADIGPREWSFCLIDPTGRQHKQISIQVSELLALRDEEIGGGHPNFLSNDEFEKKYVVDGRFYIGVRAAQARIEHENYPSCLQPPTFVDGPGLF
jgi:hypothetical protein